MKLQRKQKSRGPTKGKTFSDYRERHQSRVRKQTVKDCETSLSFLGFHNFVATKLEILNENTHKYETLTLVEENIQTSSPTEELTDEDINEINLLLDTKERFNISNEAYHELTMIGKHLTRSWKIQDRVKEMNRNVLLSRDIWYPKKRRLQDGLSQSTQFQQSVSREERREDWYTQI